MASGIIYEVLGLQASDPRIPGLSLSKICQIDGLKCIKKLPVCVLSNGASPTQTIVCWKRLLGHGRDALRGVALEAFPDAQFIMGGDAAALKRAYENSGCRSAVVHGQGSNRECQVRINGVAPRSIDWVVKLHDENGHYANQYAIVEVQTVDTTGSYAPAADALLRGDTPPGSAHGLNNLNVIKRLCDQLKEKGAAASRAKDCVGVFFLLPDIVWESFEAELGDMQPTDRIGNDTLSVRTYKPEPDGTVSLVRGINIPYAEFIAAYTKIDPDAGPRLDDAVRAMG